MVEVEWKVVAIATPMPPQKTGATGREMLMIGVAVFLVIVLSTLKAISVAKARARKNEPQPIHLVQPTTDTMPVPEEPETEMVSVEQNGKRLLVPITLKDGVWYTPFATQVDSTKVVFRQKRRAAIEAVKVCVANPFYETAIEQLIAEGTIKVQKEKRHEEVPQLQA
jgi:nitrogen fixation protein FixH